MDRLSHWHCVKQASNKVEEKLKAHRRYWLREKNGRNKTIHLSQCLNGMTTKCGRNIEHLFHTSEKQSRKLILAFNKIYFQCSISLFVSIKSESKLSVCNLRWILDVFLTHTPTEYTIHHCSVCARALPHTVIVRLSPSLSSTGFSYFLYFFLFSNVLSSFRSIIRRHTHYHVLLVDGLYGLYVVVVAEFFRLLLCCSFFFRIALLILLYVLKANVASTRSWAQASLLCISFKSNQ